MPSSTEKVRCPKCDKVFTVDVETQYERDVRLTPIKGKPTPVNPTEIMYSSPTIINSLIDSLKQVSSQFNDFNLEVAEVRVEKGMSDSLRHLYKLMGSFDQRLRELITDAKIISANYSNQLK